MNARADVEVFRPDDGRAFVESLIREAVASVNGGVSRTLTARRAEEQPPRNARHLTDTRTRVSTLLEYSVAYEANNVLARWGLHWSVSAVLWNVFPDLIIRDETRLNEFGLELKALHTAAEEKSANLDTPLGVIRKGKDFVVILVWGWVREDIDGVSVTYPHIHDARVFDAWQLARGRDYGWLKDARVVKGIDIGGPIIQGARDSSFKAEEGNMGKLMRIRLPHEVDIHLPDADEMIEEFRQFELFQSRALAWGLSETIGDIAFACEANALEKEELISYPAVASIIATASGPSGNPILFAAGRITREFLGGVRVGLPDGSSLVLLSSKLAWKVLHLRSGDWVDVADGKHPESELGRISGAVNHHP